MSITITEFLKKHKRVFNITRLELYCRVPVNTISHAIGSEKRPLPLAYEDAIYKYLEEMENDLSGSVVDYWQKHRSPSILKKLTSQDGDRSHRVSKPKRQAK